MLPTLVRGPDKSIQGVQLFEGTEFEVDTGKPMPINTDGEILTKVQHFEERMAGKASGEGH
mgnify:CR=1 FL=1